jgi:hypothetical protein
MNTEVNGADRMRQTDRIIAGVEAKLQAHRRELGQARVIHITCHYDNRGNLEITLQTTF